MRPSIPVYLCLALASSPALAVPMLSSRQDSNTTLPPMRTPRIGVIVAGGQPNVPHPNATNMGGWGLAPNGSMIWVPDSPGYHYTQSNHTGNEYVQRSNIDRSPINDNVNDNLETRSGAHNKHSNPHKHKHRKHPHRKHPNHKHPKPLKGGNDSKHKRNRDVQDE